MSATITRTAWTDDDGTGTTGTIINNAEKTALYDQIEAFVNVSAPTSYSPTWGNTGTANTVGNGSVTGSYVQVGKRVYFNATITWGSTTSSGNASWTISVPVTAAGGTPRYGAINGFAQDSSAGGTVYPCMGFLTSSTTIHPVTLDVVPATIHAATVPFTWATSDVLNLAGWYFAA